MVEHPYRPQFKLANDLKPAERTRDLYRFEVEAAEGPAGRGARSPRSGTWCRRWQLTNSDDQQIRFFLQQQVLSQAVREALEKAVGPRGTTWPATQRELQQAERSVQQIEKDQGRLRENLKETPPTAAAYKRYLEKLDPQEAEIGEAPGEPRAAPGAGAPAAARRSRATWWA